MNPKQQGKIKETYLTFLKKMPGCSTVDLITKAMGRKPTKEEAVTPYNHIRALIKNKKIKALKKGTRQFLYLPEQFPKKSKKGGTAKKTSSK